MVGVLVPGQLRLSDVAILVALVSPLSLSTALLVVTLLTNDVTKVHLTSTLCVTTKAVLYVAAAASLDTEVPTAETSAVPTSLAVHREPTLNAHAVSSSIL